MNTTAVTQELTLTGFDAEVYDVARRIKREAERNQARGTLPNVRRAVRQLHRLATVLHQLYEVQCNREMRASEYSIERRTEARILELCHMLGVRASFNGDPRGSPVRIPCAKENANGWGGEEIVIPYGPARDYAKSRVTFTEGGTP